ncbi:hypothetical protein J7K50_04395 [bacterium]|nr:hypothetical protein [bacterium]
MRQLAKTTIWVILIIMAAAALHHGYSALQIAHRPEPAVCWMEVYRREPRTGGSRTSILPDSLSFLEKLLGLNDQGRSSCELWAADASGEHVWLVNRTSYPAIDTPVQWIPAGGAIVDNRIPVSRWEQNNAKSSYPRNELSLLVDLITGKEFVIGNLHRSSRYDRSGYPLEPAQADKQELSWSYLRHGVPSKGLDGMLTGYVTTQNLSCWPAKWDLDGDSFEYMVFPAVEKALSGDGSLTNVYVWGETMLLVLNYHSYDKNTQQQWFASRICFFDLESKSLISSFDVCAKEHEDSLFPKFLFVGDPSSGHAAFGNPEFSDRMNAKVRHYRISFIAPPSSGDKPLCLVNLYESDGSPDSYIRSNWIVSFQPNTGSFTEIAADETKYFDLYCPRENMLLAYSRKEQLNPFLLFKKHRNFSSRAFVVLPEVGRYYTVGSRSLALIDVEFALDKSLWCILRKAGTRSFLSENTVIRIDPDSGERKIIRQGNSIQRLYGMCEE